MHTLQGRSSQISELANGSAVPASDPYTSFDDPSRCARDLEDHVRRQIFFPLVSYCVLPMDTVEIG
jgi:hypothetical protein